MELTKIDSKTKIDLVTNTTHEVDHYTLGRYEVRHFVHTYDDDSSYEGISVINQDHDFLPDICFEDGYFNGGKKSFTIQTCAYGALTSDEIKQVIAGYQEALEAVEILTKKFC